MGHHIVMANRDVKKSEDVTKEITSGTGNKNVEFIQCDLASFESIRKCAETFLNKKLPLHVLMLNAGLMGGGLTKDGFNTALGVNHLGHFLLTILLLNKLRESAPARIVVLSSSAHNAAGTFPFDDWKSAGSADQSFSIYARSKLANLYFAQELAKKLKAEAEEESKKTGKPITDFLVTCNALHPGVVTTGLWRTVPCRSCCCFSCFACCCGCIDEEAGAKTQIFCAINKDLNEVTGKYFDLCQQKYTSQLSKQEAVQTKLWELSEEWTGVKYPSIVSKSD